MAGYRFADIVSDIKSVTNLKNQDDLIKRLVNQGLAEIVARTNLPYYHTFGFFTTVDDESTGTVDMTNNSATITGSGTSFTAAMVGRKIRIDGANAYYTIKSFASSTSMTMDQPYQGSTDTGLSYSIFQDEYRLAPDVDRYHFLRDIEQGVPLWSVDKNTFDRFIPTPNSSSDALWEVSIGRDTSTDTTGTIDATVGSATLTGTGTSWTSVQGLGRGSKLQISTSVFTVKSVDSDTQITAYENATAAATGATFTIILDNTVVQLYPIPDAIRNIYYRYYRIPAPLINDQDIPDLPHQWHQLLLWYVIGHAFMQPHNPAMADEGVKRYADGIAQLQRQANEQSTSRIWQRSSVDAVRRTVGRYPPDYDTSVRLP